MSLFRWESRILNNLYKTDRYKKLAQTGLKDVEEIDYQLFFQLTPGSSTHE